MIAVTMGDMAEVNCGLPLNDSDSLTWFHNGRKLTVPSDRYSSPSLGALRFKVLSVEDEGTYECVSPLGGSHSVQLILFQAMTGNEASFTQRCAYDNIMPHALTHQHLVWNTP